MKQLLLFLIILSVCSCKNDAKRDTMYSLNHRSQSDSRLRKLVMNSGDRDAYDDLSISYLDYPIEEFLPYALIMANKYDYPQAYYDVYYTLWIWFNSPDSLDNTTKKMALDYLQKASLRGHFQARETLGEYYMEGIYFEKDTILGKRLIQEAKTLPY